MKGKQPRSFTHEEIKELLETFPSLFNPEFIDELDTLEWPQDVSYKETFNHVLEQEYGWTDLGKKCIETRLHSSVEYLGLKDKYDYPIMAAALEEGVDLIVTANMADFINPLGKIQVMGAHAAWQFDHFELHSPMRLRSLFPLDED